ncbi:MAG: peptidoglycan DD-metalloendopeptidase family protein [Pseudomonadota bacterium]
MSMVLLWTLPVHANESTDRSTETAQRLAELRQNILQIKTQIQTTQHQRDQVGQSLEKSEIVMSELQQTLHDLTKRYDKQQQQLKRLRKQAKQQQLTLQRERRELVKQIRTAYQMGRQQQVKLLLNQQDKKIFSRMLTYYDYLNHTRMIRMSSAKQVLEQLTHTQHDIVQKQEQLLTLRTQQQSAQHDLQITQQQRQQLLTQLDQQLHQQDAELQRRQADAEQLQSLLDQLQRALTNRAVQQQTEPFSHKRGQLSWPTQGHILHRFGARKIGSMRWDGVLMQAEAGQPVQASYGGQVVFADWLRGFGLLLIIDHGEGYLSLYGHNQRLLKTVGDQVSADEPIAQAGNTGGRRTAGLYFAIRHQGQPIDPALWCRR